ncbi:hypothetical protein HBE96_12850 [Clostridium sp. P21]|uniref:LXG domain-containing protein n=1 Tax=Clostridium muellerianum TaxID=2716538 RepID=A0A7Y0EHM7_9CLOT|nr:hypothetical protein [Clostridium muellerianum]NMM63547.1 hypothetical protein [Clostridium muellerianum]
MARSIGYSGILAVDYNECDELIRLLENTKRCAETDLDNLNRAFSYAEGCDGIGSAIPNAIRSVKDKIERLERFKKNFSDYIEDIKEFDYYFAADVSNNRILEAIRHNISIVNFLNRNVDVQSIEKLEKLLEIEKFYNMMNKCYGFKPEEARLILKAYELSMNPKEGYMTKEQAMARASLLRYNPNLKIELTDEQKLKEFLKNLSTLGTYHGFLWECVDNAPTENEAKDYFKEMGMSAEEVNNLKKIMVTQHSHDKVGKKDFAHEIVEIASYLNAGAGGGRLLADAGNFGHTNEMASIKGDIWSGSMSDSDLYANIDSVNIYNRAKNNKYSDFMSTFTNYNTSVASGKINRANEYCANYGDGDIEKGKQKIKNIIESRSPGGEFLTHEPQDAINYGWSQMKDEIALTIAKHTKTKGEVDKMIHDIDKSADDYIQNMKDKESDIKSAKHKFYNCLGI